MGENKVDLFKVMERVDKHIALMHNIEPKGFLKTIGDINLSQFFSERNLKTIKYFLYDEENGLYTTLNYVTTLISNLKLDYYPRTSKSLLEIVSELVGYKLEALKGLLEAEKPLFISNELDKRKLYEYEVIFYILILNRKLKIKG